MKGNRRYSVEKETGRVGNVSEPGALAYQHSIRKVKRTSPERSHSGGIQSLSETLQSMGPEEILASQRQWWKQAYSSDAVHSRMTSVLSGRASESKWLTAEEADEEVGRTLPWLR